MGALDSLRSIVDVDTVRTIEKCERCMYEILDNVVPTEGDNAEAMDEDPELARKVKLACASIIEVKVHALRYIADRSEALARRTRGSEAI